MTLGMLQKWVTFNMAILFSERYDFYPFVSGVTDDCKKFHGELSITNKNTLIYWFKYPGNYFLKIKIKCRHQS